MVGDAGLVLRRAEPDDEVAVRACVVAAYSHYIARLGMAPGPLREDYAALIAQGIVYVLVAADGLRGLVVTTTYDDSQFLANIAVDPRYQGQGLGRRLMAFVGEQARQARRDAITLYTHELMTENRALYARLGFVEVAFREEHGFRRVYMRKTLPGHPAS